MITRLTRLQAQLWLRDRRLLGMLAGVVLLLALSSVWATAGDITRRVAQEDAAASARSQWLERGADHPHRRAHYGDYVFRPAGPMARLDRGVQAQLGKVLRVEAHGRSTPLHADASRAGTVARFQRPDAAFLLQSVVPLLLIFLGAAGLVRDRDSGRLRLALVQGLRVRDLASAHFLALWGLSLALLAVVVVASLATSQVLDAGPADAWSRLGAFVAVHALFLAVVSSAVVASALWSSSARSSLVALLGVWVVCAAVLPRVSASVANTLYPLPSQDAFQAAMRADREAGPDGHNPEDEAIAARKQALLEEYGVESADDLPLDFGGIAMQMDEEFGNRVWDDHYGDLQHRFTQQGRIGTVSALMNPIQAVDHLSMAVAGTDLAHDLAFQSQAEAYRRELVHQLNHEHAYGGPQDRGEPWEAAPEFFAGLAAFEHTPPTVEQAVHPRIPELISLGAWTLMLLLAVRVGADRLEDGRAAC